MAPTLFFSSFAPSHAGERSLHLLASHLLFFASFGALGCTSTETGNPGTERPGKDAPLEGIPIELRVGLRAPTSGLDSATPGVPEAVITALWLSIAEVDFITCAGESLSTSGLSTGENLAAPQGLTVTAPSEEICAMVVRTSPLSATSESSLPESALGQGAALEGVDANSVPFSVVLPERITSVLTPVTAGLTLDKAIDLELKIEAAPLLDALFGAPGQLPTVPLNANDADNDPALTSAIATRLGLAVSLEGTVGETRQVLATASAPWPEVGDLLCTSECALQERSACGATPCDVDECIRRLQDPLCGESFQMALHCRVGLNPNEYTCAEAIPSVTTTHCALPDSNYSTCRD